MTGIYRFADRNIAIYSTGSEIHTLCKDYLVGENADFSVEVTQEDIETERLLSIRENEAKGVLPRRFSDGYLETLAVYRKIAERMPCFDTILFHGSCIAVDGEGYLFTAKSGTGKSTHTRLWRDLLGERAIMVNDDKPLIRVYDDETVVAYGTPWDGKHRLSSNSSVPLKGICLLERAMNNDIREITKAEGYPMLLQQTYRPSNPDALKRTLLLLDRMNVKLYRLCCNMEVSAAELSYNVMKG